MAYGIGQARKLGKHKKKLIYNTTDPSSAPSTTSYSYDELNENTDITSKKLLSAETRSITILYLEDKPSDITQNKSAPNPYSKDMLISNISVDNNVQLFETPRKTIPVSLHQETIFCLVFIIIGRLILP